MNHYLTEIRAIDPREEVKTTTDGLHVYTGPFIKANSLEEAEEFCRNHVGYLHVLGLSGDTITPTDLVIDTSTYQTADQRKNVDFLEALRSLINRYSKENVSNTPDFVLASFLYDTLSVFNYAVIDREKWYGRAEESPVNVVSPEPSQNMCSLAPPDEDQIIFSAGDVVTLKTGGIFMTVEDNCLGQSKILCVWFDDSNKLNREIFSQAVLEIQAN